MDICLLHPINQWMIGFVIGDDLSNLESIKKVIIVKKKIAKHLLLRRIKFNNIKNIKNFYIIVTNFLFIFILFRYSTLNI